MYSFLRPVCFLPFTNEDINMPNKIAKQSCTESSWGRGNYNPLPDGTHLHTRTHPDVVAVAKEIYAEYSKCSQGGKCGAEIGYPHDFEAGQLETDEPLLDEKKARKWNILRGGSYVFDKGFRIHSMLHRHGAGGLKPPHRMRGQKQNTADEVKDTMKVAHMRIHVERDNRRAREFHGINKTSQISHMDLVSDEVWVAFMLGNFQCPLIGNDFHK